MVVLSTMENTDRKGKVRDISVNEVLWVLKTVKGGKGTGVGGDPVNFLNYQGRDHSRKIKCFHHFMSEEEKNSSGLKSVLKGYFPL